MKPADVRAMTADQIDDEILKLKSQGHSLRRIAASLGCGYGTVRTRLQRVS